MIPHTVFVAHRGANLLSRIISWFRPPYSHIEMWFYGREFHGRVGKRKVFIPSMRGKEVAGVVISADANGVVARPIPKTSPYGKGTVVDFFTYREPLSKSEDNWLWHAAKTLVGCPYDMWELVFGFTFKGTAPKASLNKYICSGMVLKATQDLQFMCDKKDSKKLRVLAKRVREDRVAPRDLTRSPLLKWTGSGVLP